MKCDIEGVIIRELSRIEDDRGYLVELFRQDELDKENYPVMSYVSMTRPGVVRGPHEHSDQADYFVFAGSSTFKLYLWDNRPGSINNGHKVVLEIAAGQFIQVIVPPGVVHAYQNVGTVDGIVYNAPNRLYAGKGRQEAVDEIRYENDPGSPFRLD